MPNEKTLKIIRYILKNVSILKLYYPWGKLCVSPGIKPKFLGSEGYWSAVPLDDAEGVDKPETSRFLAACRSNIALFQSGMSSSAFEVCCDWTEEEDAPPDALVVRDENEPISAPIKDRWALRETRSCEWMHAKKDM